MNKKKNLIRPLPFKKVQAVNKNTYTFDITSRHLIHKTNWIKICKTKNTNKMLAP